MNRYPIWRILVILVVLFLAIQLLPYGRDHTNPPVKKEPIWDNPQTQLIAKRSCFDCHSNETAWPWYASIAPLSWLVQRDVEIGRDVLNFSDWEFTRQGEHYEHFLEGEFDEVILRDAMPPQNYLLLHPEAFLTGKEKQQLVDGLNRTVKNSQ